MEMPVSSLTGLTLKDLLDSGLHFGHQTKRWNPKMKRYIFDKRNGIHIIDLTQTITLIDEAAAFLRETALSGKKILFTSDGNFTEFIDDVVATGVHGLVMEPTTDMAYVAQRYGKTHAFIGNADTRILLRGSRNEIRNEVQRCMAIGKACPGFFLAVGNHIPPNTPVESAIYYNQVYEELSRR